MKVVKWRERWVLQIYHPEFRRIKSGFNITFGTALTIDRHCFAWEILGFGFGIAYFPKKEKVQ